MKIILIRHGETIWNKESRLQGCTDIPLAPAGYEQLCVTGEHLAKIGLPIDQILSSPLQRAHKSAEIIAEKITAIINRNKDDIMIIFATTGISLV